MVAGGNGESIRLFKIKRPGGVFWFDLSQVGQDHDGTWLQCPVGSPWGAPHDPVLHTRDSCVEIEDWDEYEQALRYGWMSTEDAKLARATAEERAAALQRQAEVWLERGWQMLPQQV